MIIKQSTLYLFALVFCLFAQLSLQQTIPFPKAVLTEMASRQTRYHHYLWHNIRDNWNSFSASVKKNLTALKWNPPRPSRSFDRQGNPTAITDNNSGEDFLYMHRQMIKRVNDIITQNNDPYGNVTGWKTLPAPGDAEWPVPAPYTIPGGSAATSAINTRKSVAYYNDTIKPMEDFFRNTTELKKMTLGQLGSRIEVTVHNWLHLRFSSVSTYGYRPGASGAIPSVETRWDDPKYDWLGDTYSSHVNPIFWKLHGWVNDRIDDWANANNVTNIRWQGTWEGGPMENVASAIGAMAMKSAAVSQKTANSNGGMDSMNHGSNSGSFAGNPMNDVFKVFSQVGQETSFTDDVKVDFEVPKKNTKRNLRRKIL